MATTPVEENAAANSVERLPSHPRQCVVSEELNRLIESVRNVCPQDATISFLFDGKLHLVIDVHTLEDVLAIELTLPKLGAGMFHDIQRGTTPHNAFLHRITALVDR